MRSATISRTTEEKTMEKLHITGIDAATIQSALEALTCRDPKEVMIAALYLFPDGKGMDEVNPRTFTSLCNRNGIDADNAAKALWNRLTPERRMYIRVQLYRAGCKVWLPPHIAHQERRKIRERRDMHRLAAQARV
jgi:hypothetical protein